MSQPFGLASAESYDFDAGGNRKSSGGASQSAANTHNQLQTDGTYNYTYDDEGNTLSRTVISTGAVTLYEWDHRNRLESITEKTSAVGSVTQKIQYIYDALDQRVGKRLDNDGDGDFDRDEVFLWTEGQTVLRATDSDGEAATETFTLASRYLYGEMVDQLLADEQYNGGAGPELSATTASATAGDTYWALTDHLGSVRDVVDNSGVIRQHVAYDSFGNRIVEQDYDASGSAISSSHADAIDELFGYTGRDWDADAELQNNRARWYDPATGRWLSNDPTGFAAGDANLYRYVGNGPTNATDPSGLFDIFPLGAPRTVATSAHMRPNAANNMLNSSRWRFEWQFPRDEGLLVVQEVRSKGKLWVQLTNGCEISLIWDQTYLEAWSGPQKDVNYDGAIRDTHSAGVPGKHMLDIIGGTFAQPPSPRNSEGEPSRPEIYYRFPDGRVETVHQWKFEETANFRLGLVNGGVGRGLHLKRNLKNEIHVEGDCVKTTRGDSWIRTTHGATISQTLTMPTPIAAMQDEWKSSYHTGDTRVRLEMKPGKYSFVR